jgi:hypothetical protein
MRRKAVARSDGGLFRARGCGLRGGGLLTLMVAVATLLLASCGAEEGQQGGDEDAGGKAKTGEKAGQQGPEAGLTRPAERVTVEELTSNPSEFYGDTVTVSGEVIEAVEPGAFRIENDGTRLLVVGVEQIPKIVNGDTKAVNEGDLIKATGEVRQFKKEEIQKNVDYGIDDEYFGDYKGDPAVLAYSVAVLS